MFDLKSYQLRRKQVLRKLFGIDEYGKNELSTSDMRQMFFLFLLRMFAKAKELVNGVRIDSFDLLLCSVLSIDSDGGPDSV